MKMEQNTTHIKLNSRFSTKGLVLTGMFTALICVLSQITIPTPQIPFTLSLLAIFLTGAILSPRYALLAVLAYILLGAFGLPVFAGMRGGVGVLFDKTGGYILAYPVMAFVTSLFHSKRKKTKTVFLAAGMIISLILCYLIGTAWFSHVTGIEFLYALTLCVYPFILFDVLKIILSIPLSIIINKTLLRHNENIT